MAVDTPTPRHAVILAHPGSASFNHSVAESYRKAVEACHQAVVVRDLYAMGFDPLLKDGERPGRDFEMSADVTAERALIGGSAVFTLIYPIWFGMPPAILLGYLDRVLGAAIDYEHVKEGSGLGVLTGRRLLSIETSGTRDVWLDEQGQMESLRDCFTRYLADAFAMKGCEHLHLGGVVDGFAPRFADQHLADVEERARHVCAIVAQEARSG